MHAVSVVAAAPSWLDERDHWPAVGAGSCASVIGPAGPAAAGAAADVAAAGVAAVDAAAAGAALDPFAAELSAVFEHPTSATAPSARPSTKPRIRRLPVCSVSAA